MVRQIPPDELQSVWPQIREGLEEVKRKCGETWIPEDVYTAIKIGTSSLHMLSDGGFLVLTPKREEHTNRPILHVWIGHTQGNDYLEGEEYLDTLCKQYGFAKVTQISARRGWERRGWKPARIMYEREVK